MSDRKSKVQELYENMVGLRNALKAAQVDENMVRNEVKSELDRLSKATFRTDPDLRRKMEEELDVEHSAYQVQVGAAKDVFEKTVATARKQMEEAKKAAEAIYTKKRQSITASYNDRQRQIREAAHAKMLEAESRGQSAIESRIDKVKDAAVALKKAEDAHDKALEEAKRRREEAVKAGKEKSDAKLVQQQPAGERGAE